MDIENVLKEANELDKQQRVIGDKIYDVLWPLCTKLMEEKNISDIEYVLAKMPGGFERSELRTFLNQLKKV